MAKLILRGDGGTERELSLDGLDTATIGRSPECEMPIDDTQASRRHASVVRLQSGYEVADLGSTNGTLVNSTLTKRRRLNHGDVIRIGSTEIVFSDPGAAAARSGGESANCVLVFAKGERKGDRIELSEPRTTIGRKESNTVVLKDSVASSYHCEIVRDLNGYVIRDLGSTNGTLVNNEMVTEAQLSHGARIRIGNVRFVFQDPAMSDIDLELAGVDDDEAEWGMMRELDLKAVRKRNPATIFYGVLFLALIGGGAYMTTLERGKGAAGPQPPPGNLHQPFSFETAAATFAWDSDQPGAVTTSLATSPKGQGKSSLEIKSSVEEADVFYSDRLVGTRKQVRLRASAAARGCTARLGLLWSGLGLGRWVLAPIPGSSMSSIELVASAPTWATGVQIGVRIQGTGSVFLDDLSLVPVGAAEVQTVEQNNFLLGIVDHNAADLSQYGTPILVNGRAIALDAAGAETDASGLSVTATAPDGDHMLITVEGGGDAAAIGLEFEDERGTLTRGGYRAFTPDDAETNFHAVFPEEGTLDLTGVRKLLLGPSGRAFAVIPATEGGRLRSIARMQGDRATWAVVGPPEDGKFAFRFKTNLTADTQLATDRTNEALSRYEEKKWGDFLDLANSTLAEFPFMSPARQKQLRERAQTANAEYALLRNEARRLIRDYEEFRDLGSLDRVRDILATLRDKFQVKAGEGPRGQFLEEIASREKELREEAERKRQSALAKQLLEQAEYIHLEQGETFSAAVLLFHVVHYLPMSEQAARAKELLATIQEKNPEAVAILDRLAVREE